MAGAGEGDEVVGQETSWVVSRYPDSKRKSQQASKGKQNQLPVRAEAKSRLKPPSL